MKYVFKTFIFLFLIICTNTSFAQLNGPYNTYKDAYGNTYQLYCSGRGCGWLIVGTPQTVRRGFRLTKFNALNNGVIQGLFCNAYNQCFWTTIGNTNMYASNQRMNTQNQGIRNTCNQALSGNEMAASMLSSSCSECSGYINSQMMSRLRQNVARAKNKMNELQKLANMPIPKN